LLGTLGTRSCAKTSRSLLGTSLLGTSCSWYQVLCSWYQVLRYVLGTRSCATTSRRVRVLGSRSCATTSRRVLCLVPGLALRHRDAFGEGVRRTTKFDGAVMNPDRVLGQASGERLGLAKRDHVAQKCRLVRLDRSAFSVQ